MGTTITFSRLEDAVVLATITGDGVFSSYTYDKLIDWQSLPPVDLGFQKRPNAPGAFAPGQTFPDEATISVEGQFFGASRAAAIQAREDLTALYNNGFPIKMSVADDLRTTSRIVYVKAVGLPWTIHPEFKWTIDVVANDPRRYGDTLRVGTTLAQSGTGLTLPIVFPLDFGSVPIDGRVLVSNPGNAETVSVYTISGGEMLDGFVIVNVDTGERLTYIGPATAGSTVVLDTAAGVAFINGVSPAGRFLASPQWWTIPPKTSRSVQFLARGPVTGTPRVDIDTAPAFY